MWPNDWKIEYSPTLSELRMSLATIEYYRNMLLDELATAGVQSEFSIREGLQQLNCMHAVLMDYFFQHD